MRNLASRLKRFYRDSPGRFFLGSGGLILVCLAVRGRFEHGPRLPHQIGWAMVALGACFWMAGKSSEEPNRWKGAAKALLAYLTLGGFLLFPFLMSDGDFYYGVIRSILWEGDTNTANEASRYARGWLVEQGPMGGPFGFPSHPFPIGVSLSWIPFIFLGHLDAVLQNLLFDPSLPRNGWSAPYESWVGIGTATWGSLFVVFSYLLARLRFDHSVSIRAVVGSLMATPAFYYCFRDCGFPHAHSMAALTLFFWIWLRDPSRRDWKQVGLVGLSLSAAALVRWQNCLFALAPVLYWMGTAIPADASKGRTSRLAGGFGSSLGLGAFCFLLCFPQMVFFRLRGPGWLGVEHGGEAWSWGAPKLYELFFDADYGLWFWTPFYFLSALGFVAILARARGIRCPFALLLICGALEIYVDASYVLWHGGGDYGNRFIVDLMGLVVLGFAGVLGFARGRVARWIVALAWTACFGWGMALLWQASPRFTRTPIRITERFSHGTPFASFFQGFSNFDLGMALSGLWLFAALCGCVFALFGCVLIARGVWRTNDRSALTILAGFTCVSILCSAWFWLDLRRVDTALYVDNRQTERIGEPQNVDLVRQAFNTALTPWYAPGLDRYFPIGRERFRLSLDRDLPEVAYLLPVNWPAPDKPTPYVIEKLALLSRVRSDRELEPGEEIATLTLSQHFPPTSTEWTLRAGVHTDEPTSTRLPSSSPDWHATGSAGSPRYFCAEFPASPTQGIDVLKIALLPDDVTLEVGAVWMSSSPFGPTLSYAQNPNNLRVTDHDRRLFGPGSYEAVPFPARLNPDVDHPETEIFQPHEDARRLPRGFRFFRDPWRLAGETPFALGIGSFDGARPPSWWVLDWHKEAVLEVPLPEGPIEEVAVAMCAGPIPKNWTGGPLAVLELHGSEGGKIVRPIRPGRDLAFWGEPYQPRRNQIWREDQGFHIPVGASVVRARAFADQETEKIILKLSKRGYETGAQAAVLGITVKR